MIHTFAIAMHAVAATVALATGLAAFRLHRFTGAHTAATLLMTLTLAMALWAGRNDRVPATTVVFLGLLALAIVMFVLAVGAWRSRPIGGRTAGARYLAAVGFNCISLVAGLLAIGVLRLGWGTAAIVAAVLLPILVGRVPVGRAVRAAARAS